MWYEFVESRFKTALEKSGIPEKQEYTVIETAMILVVTPRTIQRFMKSGKLFGVHEISPRKRLIPVEGVRYIFHEHYNYHYPERAIDKIYTDFHAIFSDEYCEICKAYPHWEAFLELVQAISMAVQGKNVTSKLKSLARGILFSFHVYHYWGDIVHAGFDFTLDRYCNHCGSPSKWASLFNIYRIILEYAVNIYPFLDRYPHREIRKIEEIFVARGKSILDGDK